MKTVKATAPVSNKKSISWNDILKMAQNKENDVNYYDWRDKYDASK